ncbi:MAG TPA: hypothetical protein VF909_16900 [Roseiflexaceae bacterium]
MKPYRYLILTIALALLAADIPATAGAAPAGKLATYTHPDGLWSVQYPSDLLHPEQLNPEEVIFISKDLERARNLLVRYFKLLHDGYYDEAVNLYADGYDILAEWNPDVPANHYGQLLASACELQLRCLEVRRVVRATAISASQFDFVVEFSNEDGTLFKRGPCCGATEKEMPTVTQFTYSVEQHGGEMRVHGLPVYVP